MKNIKNLIGAFVFFAALGRPLAAGAFVTEIGVAYGYQKKTFNSENYYQSDSKSASLSFYFIERLALELSYTDSFYESHENDSTSRRVVQQNTSISNASIIYMLTGKKSAIQPYFKGGAAYIKKNQVVKYENASAISIPESSGWAPSYGAGIKVGLTEALSLKFSYEVWQTPLSDGTSSDDASFKAGFSWYL